MGQASSHESPGESPGEPTIATGDSILNDISQRRTNWSPTQPLRTTTEKEPIAIRKLNATQERKNTQKRSTEIRSSSTVNLGSFNPRGAYSRDFPHVEFQSSVRFMGRKDLERAQTRYSTTKKPINSPLDLNGINQNGKRSYIAESSPNFVQHLQRGRSAMPSGKKRLVGEAPSFAAAGSTNDSTMEEVDKAHSLSGATDLQEHGGVMLLQHRSSVYEWNRCRPPLKTEFSPRISSSSFFAVTLGDGPSKIVHDSNVPTGLKGIGAINRKIEEECVARCEASKPSLEALMLENGLQHPQHSHTRTSIKSPSLMSSQVIKSDTDTEKGDDNLEGNAETNLEDLTDKEDDDDEELEIQYQYFVTTRWWDAERGESNAWEEFNQAFAARNDANTYASDSLNSKVSPLIARGCRDDPKIESICGTKDGLISLRVLCGQVGATAEVERLEVSKSSRPPPQAVWIPREAYVIRRAVRRVEFQSDESSQLHRERLSAVHNEAKSLLIMTSLPKANSAASAMYFNMRTNQDGGIEWNEIFKENLRSDLWFEVRYLNKKHDLFERVWNHGRLSYEISVERCKVQGPRN